MRDEFKTILLLIPHPSPLIPQKVGNFASFVKPLTKFPRWAEKERYEIYKDLKFDLFFDS